MGAAPSKQSSVEEEVNKAVKDVKKHVVKAADKVNTASDQVVAKAQKSANVVAKQTSATAKDVTNQVKTFLNTSDSKSGSDSGVLVKSLPVVLMAAVAAGVWLWKEKPWKKDDKKAGE